MNFQAYNLSAHPDWSCISVKAQESEERGTPVHLCCIIDVSGSMETENKLYNVKHSLKFLLDFLGENDHISIITFSKSAKTVIKHMLTTVTEKENIRAQISLIKEESNTNLSAGIIESRGSLFMDTSTCKQGILLLTDGIANAGMIHTPDILNVVRNTVNKFSGTSISCIGYGTDHNIELLQQISSIGGGSYYVVNNIDDVAMVFGDVLGGLISCVAQQVRVILPAGTEIKTRYDVRATGYSDDSGSSGSLDVIIGDLPAGMEGVVLAKIPKNTTVLFRGYNLKTHDDFKEIVVVMETADETLQTNGEVHYLRFEVLAILEESQLLLQQCAPATQIDAHLQKIAACIATIRLHREHSVHTLWDLLIEQLNNCAGILRGRNYGVARLMSQHGAYLGMMRGIAASGSAHANLDEDVTNAYEGDTDNNPLSPQASHAFSNSAQRNIGARMQSSVTPVANRQRRRHGLNTTITTATYELEYTPTLSPILSPNLSPILSQVSGPTSSAVSLSQENSNRIPSPPLPGGLQRQVAAPFTDITNTN